MFSAKTSLAKRTSSGKKPLARFTEIWQRRKRCMYGQINLKVVQMYRKYEIWGKC